MGRIKSAGEPINVTIDMPDGRQVGFNPLPIGAVFPTPAQSLCAKANSPEFQSPTNRGSLSDLQHLAPG